MPSPTLKGIRNAVGRFAAKFRRTKKQPNTIPTTVYNNVNEQTKNKRRINQYSRLTKKLLECEKCKLEKSEISSKYKSLINSLSINNIQTIKDLSMQKTGCESDLQVSNRESEAKQSELNKLKSELNELKRVVRNYEAIINDTNKQSQALAEELAECKGSQPRKLGSSGNQNTSSGRQTDGITRPSGLRGVKSSSMRPSKLKRSRKPKLNTIYESNELTESSSTRRARLAKQNEMKHSALNFIKANKNAYTQKRKAINNAKEAQNAAVIQAAANTEKAANNALLRNIMLAHRGSMRHGG